MDELEIDDDSRWRVVRTVKVADGAAPVELPAKVTAEGGVTLEVLNSTTYARDGYWNSVHDAKLVVPGKAPRKVQVELSPYSAQRAEVTVTPMPAFLRSARTTRYVEAIDEVLSSLANELNDRAA